MVQWDTVTGDTVWYSGIQPQGIQYGTGGYSHRGYSTVQWDTATGDTVRYCRIQSQVIRYGTVGYTHRGYST